MLGIFNHSPVLMVSDCCGRHSQALFFAIFFMFYLTFLQVHLIDFAWNGIEPSHVMQPQTRVSFVACDLLTHIPRSDLAQIAPLLHHQ